MSPHYKEGIQPLDLFTYEDEDVERKAMIEANKPTAEDDKRMADFFRKVMESESKKNG